MPLRLTEMTTNTQSDISKRRFLLPLPELQLKVKPLQNSRFRQVLAPKMGRPPNEDIKLILEIKPASPSAGVLAPNLNLDAVMEAYNESASAISVLTDKRYFGGSFELMRTVSEKTEHPILCKDFILDPYQIYEARLFGADAVLLIVKILSFDQLHAFYDQVMSLGMLPVLEVQNKLELERALSLKPKAILINNRNLETFEISLETTLTLAPMIPRGTLVISASGFETRADMDKVLAVCSRFLIGSALMRTDPSELPAFIKTLRDP